MEVSELEGISSEQLRRYVEMRRKIDVEASSIHSITSMLALHETYGNDNITVDPVALGKINQMLNTHVLNIWEILDDFIYIVQTKLELKQLESEPSLPSHSLDATK